MIFMTRFSCGCQLNQHWVIHLIDFSFCRANINNNVVLISEVGLLVGRSCYLLLLYAKLR